MIAATNFSYKSLVCTSIIGLSMVVGGCKRSNSTAVKPNPDPDAVSYFANYSTCYVNQYEDSWWNQQGTEMTNSWGHIYTRSKDYNCAPGYQVVDCSTNSIINKDLNLSIVWLNGGTSAVIEKFENSTHCNAISKWGYHNNITAPSDAILFTDTTILTCCR